MRRPAVILAVWTLFVWGSRIRLADGAVGAVLLALTFTVAAAVTLITRTNPSVVRVLATFTVVVWVIKLVQILLLHDHGAAFRLVHVVLAVVSVALAQWAVRDLRNPARSSSRDSVGSR